MQIRYQHSHLNGLEHLQVHNPDVVEMIENVISNVDAQKAKVKGNTRVLMSGMSFFLN